MARYEIHLTPKPGAKGTNIKTVIEANDPFTARQMAEAQYGSNYRVIAHYGA